MKAEPRSLRRKMLTWLLALLLPLLALGAVNSYFRAYHFSDLAYNRALFRAALALADQVYVVRGQVVVNLPQSTFDLLEYDKDDLIYFRVTDPQGNTVIGEPGLPLPPNLPKPGEHLYYDARLGNERVSVVAFSLPLQGTSAQGTVLVQVAETRTKRTQLADEIITAMMLPQLLIVLLAGVMVYFGVSRGLAPLDRLRRAFEQRSHRDLSAVPLNDAPREVQPLLRAMNDLLQRLRESIAHQQRFTADASHQLRTPLAGLQTQAEMALRESDPAKIRQALVWISASTVRLTHLISQLLALARVEPGSGREAQLQVLDLAQLARETTGEWVSAALAKKIDLGFEAPQGPVNVNGDALTLHEMLANLLDNAIRYSPAGSEITLRLLVKDGRAQLMVEDNGPGIPVGEREQVFERFHRLPDSSGEGCGLGLAIVREIALAHQAEISINDGPAGHGTCISVSLPLCAGSAV
jgi:two-component system, OmpR family, sensor histidine kinase TctE